MIDRHPDAVVATGVLVVILLLYHYLFPRIYAGIRAWAGTRIRSIHVGSYELFNAARLLGFLVGLVRWFRILTTVALAYVWLLYVLSLFPWTRRISSATLCAVGRSKPGRMITNSSPP